MRNAAPSALGRLHPAAVGSAGTAGGPSKLERASPHQQIPSSDAVFSLLQTCAQQGADLFTCRKLQDFVIIHALDIASDFGNHLIRLFATCRSLLAANQVYIKINHPTIYTWNAIILAHGKLGEENTAFALFNKMQEREVNIRPNHVTFLALLQASHSITAIDEGMLVHDLIIRGDHVLDGPLGNTLVDMYAKCRCLDEARSIFNKMLHKDLVSWTVMIAGYAELGYGLPALELFEDMLQLGIEPCKVAYLNTLKACTSLQEVQIGRQIHEAIVKVGLEADILLASSLVDMYCKFCSTEEAHRVFDLIPKSMRNVVSWGALVSGYTLNLNGEAALELFAQMQQENILPDARIFADVVKACGSIGALDQGRQIHKQLNKSGFGSDVFVMAALVDFYGKCGRVDEARQVFDQSPKYDPALWTAMLVNYVEYGHATSVLELYEALLEEGIRPNKQIFLPVLKACGGTKAIKLGRLVHDQIVRADLDGELLIGTLMIDVYVKWGSLEEAHCVFNNLPNPDKVSWISLILGYAEHGDAVLAMDLFLKMQQVGLPPDSVTFMSILKACRSMGALEEGRVMHEMVIRLNVSSDITVENTLLDMYIKCGSLEDARKVLEMMPTRTVISWTTLICGYVEHEDGYGALELFVEMQQEGLKPNDVTLLYLLKASASTGAVKLGRWMHDQAARDGPTSDMVLGSVLVDMYASCGSLGEAHNIFVRLPWLDNASWGALISGYAQVGNWSSALKCFNNMQKQGLRPNGATYARVLSACSNAGLVQEGWHYLENMHSEFGIKPSVEHYSCMVDLLGRAGYVREAVRLLESMPVLPNIIPWTAVLTSCRNHGSMEVGACSFDHAVDLDAVDASSYLLVSGLFGDPVPWEGAFESKEAVCKSMN